MNLNIKITLIVLLLSLCFFFGFIKIANYRKAFNNTTTEELKILQYVPENHKLLFISNAELSKIISNIKKESNEKDLYNLTIIKNSILGYLGIDPGENKLEDIYNNELAISTYTNNEDVKEDILIVFRIKQNKKLNDLLNLNNKIDQSNEIVSIYRENKLNYLKFIYKTRDNYIIASSDKNLILNSLDYHDNFKKEYDNSVNLIENFGNKKNILLRKKSKTNFFLEDDIYQTNEEDMIATFFEYKDKNIITHSYLINNKKNINIYSYDNKTNLSKLDQKDYQLSIFSNLKSVLDYMKNLNEYEINFLKELDKNLNQNILLLSSNQDWIILFENKNKKTLDINNLKKIKPLVSDSLAKNTNIYTIYSKNFLNEEDGSIKQVNYRDIFSVKSEKFTALSNNLNKIIDLDSVSKEFFELNNEIDERDFLYQRIYLENSKPNKSQNFYSFNDLNFLLKYIVNFKNEKSIEIKKQLFPEKTPLFYQETSLKLF